jgi:hypothetical protein
MFNAKKIFIHLLIAVILVLPVVGLADDNPATSRLVPCDTGEACNFGALMQLIDNVIKFALFKMAVPIAAIMFAYAGFKMITAGGEAASARTQAKEIFINTAVGLVIAIAAWLIVSTILAILGYKGGWIGLYIKL